MGGKQLFPPYKSHPQINLVDHLIKTGKLAEKFLPKRMVNWKKFIGLVGKSHDLGKYTSFFQKKLAGENVDSRKAGHSLPSAILTAAIIDYYFNDAYKAYLAFVIVRGHHGGLTFKLTKKDFVRSLLGQTEVVKEIREIFTDLKRHWRYIQKELYKIFQDEELVDYLFAFVCDDQKKIRLHGRLSDGRDTFQRRLLDPSNRWRTLFEAFALYSCLVDADEKALEKTRKKQVKLKTTPKQIVEFFASKRKGDKKKGEIQQLREKLLNRALTLTKSRLHELEEGIFIICAPTGSGKTTLGLTFAFALREKSGDTRKILYVLPFINIVNQTYERITQILKTQRIEHVLKHTHLSLAEYTKQKVMAEDLSTVDLMMKAKIIDSWDSEIIVTTFVQFFASIFHDRKRFLKRFHNLDRAIIILDEIQTIEKEYWPIIKELLIALSQTLGTTIIFMTATVPTVFSSENARRIVFEGQITSVESLIEQEPPFSRYTVVFEGQITSVESLVNLFLKYWNRRKVNSAAIIVNTKRTSVEVFNTLKRKLGNSNVSLEYLSTNIIPAEREDRLIRIEEKLKRKEKVILVSTQVIEAGVDLDFDLIVRDFAPLDSLIQTAGRCNRNGEKKKKGTVVVVTFLRDNFEENKMIYGSLGPQITREILTSPKQKRRYDERELFAKLNSFFKEIEKRAITASESKKIIGALEALEIIPPKIIIKKIETVPVFIPLNQQALKARENFERAYRELRQAITSGTREVKWQKIYQLRVARVNLEKYIVEVPADTVQGLKTIENTRIQEVPKEDLDYFYAKETGWKILSSSAGNSLFL